MKKILLLFILLLLTTQAIQSQTVVLDSNGVTLKWTGTTVPSPYIVQANPRGTGMEWFAIVDNSTRNNITNYAKNIQSGITFFTRPSTSAPIPFNNIVTTLVTNMSSLFENINNFNQAISSWDLSNATVTNKMFKNIGGEFNLPIGSWNVSNVSNMSEMFYGASGFNQPIGSWNVGKVILMNSMFYNASSFNQNINSWNVSNVINMAQMFNNDVTFNQPIGSWNVSNVTDMNGMFVNASRFNQPIGSWDVSKVTNMSFMFGNTSAFNQPIGSWNVSKVTTMSDMFTNSGLSTANYDDLLIGWSTITATETPLQYYVTFSAGTTKCCNGASARKKILASRWTITDGGVVPDCGIVLDSNGVTLKYIGTIIPSSDPYLIQADPRGTGKEWFAIVNNYAKNIITNYAKGFQSGRSRFTPPGSTTPIPFNNIVTTLMTDMSSMFNDATTFNQTIASWDVSNVEYMSDMFLKATAFNQPIGHWDVSKVNNMSAMFSLASSFNQPIGSWNVSQVRNMSAMFYNASAFNQPIDSWDVSKVIYMSDMFSLASSFDRPIGSWNMSQAGLMDKMFNNSGLSTANYDATLIGWSTITATEYALQSNVTFSAGTTKYCNGASARGSIISTYGWTITDGGFDCSVSPKVVLDSNNVTLKYSGTTIPSPYLIQADPRGTGMEWFAIVNNSTKNNITNYAKGFQSGRTYFTPPSSSTPIPFNNIVTTLVTDMSLMFNNAIVFNQNIGSWDVSNVTNMEDMISDAPAFNQPIGSWNMSQVTSMSRMFVSASSFNQNIETWNVSSVTNMSYMFFNANAFNQPIDSWNVSNVTDMSGMFYHANAFKQPIGSWNVGKVSDMSDMFNNSGLSTANYDTTLIGWSTISPNETPLRTTVNFNAGTSKYCNSASARNILTSAPNNWTITDSGLDCTSLGTEEFEAISYKLYPNPVVSVLNVKIDSKLINQTYFILDTLGRSVLNGQLNEVDTAINVAQLSKGIYYIKVADNNSSKFIKL